MFSKREKNHHNSLANSCDLYICEMNKYYTCFNIRFLIKYLNIICEKKQGNCSRNQKQLIYLQDLNEKKTLLSIYSYTGRYCFVTHVFISFVS